MSGMSYESNSTDLNQSAAHDSALYDPTVHDNQIVAMYDTDAQARSAYDMLVKAGVAGGDIQVVSKGAETGTLGGVNAEDTGVWGAIKSMFVPDEDRTAYSHAVGRGHAMLIVTPTAGVDRQLVIHTLESTDPVDFDAKLEEWRQAGYDTSTAHTDYTTSMAATPSAQVTDYSATSATPVAAPVVAPAAAATAAGASDLDTIKVVEENLRVGKREVAAGAVRIRSYVVERPVQEQVRLREEHVTIDRRPVDRVATQADFGAFQERTIEARATSEEAVVGKEARVVEEIGIRKEASERTETVHDTVRKTEVEIVGDGTAPKPGTSTAGTPTTPTTGPVATPGAATSGANAPR